MASAALSLSGGGPAFCFGFLLTLVFLGFACGVLGAFMLRVGPPAADWIIAEARASQL